MKKVLIFLSLAMSWLNWSQTSPIQDIKMSPNGYFDTVLDRFGNQYQLKDLQITDEIYTKTAVISCDSGIFELHYEPGCGMDDPNNALHNARRAVVCRVFKDISDFINTPLKNAGNTTKVKIWVRNPANLSTPMPANALGSATSFYTMPYNTAINFGGIIDGEVFKTIQGGKDSYVNVSAPLVNSDGSLNSSGNYYHGMMAFNFNLPSPKTWNTNLLATTITSNEYDLYSVVLHEVTHALGFNSLLNYDGSSVFGAGYKYYTRYDRFLKNNATSQFVLSNTAGACSTMYNYGLSVSETQLHPGCGLTPPVSNTSSNSTTCGSALKFFGTSTVPIYTPNCFEPGSSYSHFEDMCIASPNDDGYFTMSNAINTGLLKRFLKPEERNALQDIGYSLSMMYGNNSVVVNSNISYTSPTLTALDVEGINDGIASNGTFSFIGNAGASIAISGILANDYNATSFECVQDVFDSTANITISSTTINFTSNVPGLHLLRYVPVNTVGKRGNITYVYVYLSQINNCGIPTSVCDLIINGNFEQYSSLPSDVGGNIFNNSTYNACNWKQGTLTSPDYYHVDATPPYGHFVKIPCNYFGYENDNNQGKAYGGMIITKLEGSGSVYSEPLVTKLKSPLLPNVSYSLSFDVSLTEGSRFAAKLQVFLTKNEIPLPPMSSPNLGGLNIPSSELNMLFIYPNFTTRKDGWERLTFIIPARASAGEEYLYLGGLKDIEFTDVPTIQFACENWSSFIQEGNYYLDNVSLIPLNGANFDFPAQVCNSVTLSNLTTFLTAAPSNGVFSGTGVINTNGIYSFNATTAGVGTHTVTYTYTNSSGCQVSISDSIQVLPSSDPSCTANNCPASLTFTTTEGGPSATYQASNTIVTNTNYLVNAGSTITLKAGNSITFSPSSEVKANSSSNFTAQIEACSPSARMVEEFDKDLKEQRLIDELVVYPNPTKDNLTLEIRNDKISRILITTLEGKVVFEKLIEETNSHQLDISSYQNGLYMLNVETIGGQRLNRKIIKN